VVNDLDTLFKMGVQVMAGQLASNGDVVRHAPGPTAEVVVRLAEEGRKRKTLQP